VDAHLVSGHHRLAELRVLDRHEVDELACGARPQGLHHQHGRGLRHALDDQHARHHRVLREVALEEVLVDGDVLDADGGGALHDIHDAVHHQEGKAVRNGVHDARDVVGFDRRPRLRRLFAARVHR
jgi:hypothetical protein